MRPRAALCHVFALCMTVLLVPLLLVQPAASGATPTARSATYDREVSLRGTVRTLAAVGDHGESLLPALATPRRTYWLDLGGRDAPAAGATVTVTGRLVGDTAVDVSRIRVVAGPRSRTARAGLVNRTPAHTRVLVVRAYWRQRPASPTRAQARSVWLRQSDAWFEEVSHGRYSLTGTVTAWVKVRRPAGDCVENSYRLMDSALAAARRLGYRTERFGRHILYLPCDGHGIAGLGSIDGPSVWVYGDRSVRVSVHEQGHNLGLLHAQARTCLRAGSPASWGECRIDEYGDPFDAMGSGDGHYSAFQKDHLGWLQRHRTLTGSDTVTLRPFETTGRGLKAARVRVSAARSYWLEYRTRHGLDGGAVAGGYGLQVRRVDTRQGGSPQLVDAQPDSGIGWVGDRYVGEMDRSVLPVGHTLTTPEGVRIRVLDRSGRGLRVHVGFPRPRS